MKGSDKVEKLEPLFHLDVFGYNIGITSSVVVQWVIIVLVSLIAIVATRDLKKIPDRKQSVLEIFVGGAGGAVKENMGEAYIGFVPYIGTLAIYLLAMNLSAMIGVPSPTEDLSVTAGMAAITFVVIQAYTIKKIGIVHYFTAFGKPIPALLPINLLERLMLPVSLSLRLFGNITAGTVILGLVYKALISLSPFAALIIPVPLHMYFDLFDGAVQMVIFVVLTMVNIKIISEH